MQNAESQKREAMRNHLQKHEMDQDFEAFAVLTVVASDATEARNLVTN